MTRVVCEPGQSAGDKQGADSMHPVQTGSQCEISVPLRPIWPSLVPDVRGVSHSSDLT